MISTFFENGTLVMLASCIFFAVFDSLIKYLVGSFTIGQIAFVRFSFGALIMLPTLLGKRPGINRRDFFYLVLRGVLGVAGFYATVRGFQVGTLSLTMVLFYTNPLWALFMGAFLLDEKLTWERSACVTTAIIGIVILIDPWGTGFVPGHLYGLAAGMVAGLATVVTRHLRARQDSRTIYGFQCFVGTLFSIPFVAGEVRFPGMAEGTLLFILAVFGLLAQVIMNYGFRFIKAAEGATLMMTEAILTTLVGVVIFHEPLTLAFSVGTVMILGSGIYLGLRSRRQG
jgi:drug/metabolite transporter (DMT)-like permease